MGTTSCSLCAMANLLVEHSEIFPASSRIARNPDMYSAQDLEIVKNKLSTDPEEERNKVLN